MNATNGIDLSVCMAHYDDFAGLWATIRDLKNAHRSLAKRMEILVVDNNPNSKAGKSAADYLKKCRSAFADARWIPLDQPKGTSPPRDLAMREARGRVIMCIDPHISIDAGALDRLIAFADQHPESQDLWHGPILDEADNVFATRFDPVWRAEMYGTWASDEQGRKPDDEPFEIPGMGMGLFACRQGAWLGFPAACRGFGGEELMIHEKYRQAGRKVLCLPFLRWEHRFGWDWR